MDNPSQPSPSGLDGGRSTSTWPIIAGRTTQKDLQDLHLSRNLRAGLAGARRGAVAGASAHRPATSHEKVLHKDGRPSTGGGLPLAIDADGQVANCFGTNTDITELQQVEAALRESEERYGSCGLSPDRPGAYRHIYMFANLARTRFVQVCRASRRWRGRMSSA